MNSTNYKFKIGKSRLFIMSSSFVASFFRQKYIIHFDDQNKIKHNDSDYIDCFKNFSKQHATTSCVRSSSAV